MNNLGKKTKFGDAWFSMDSDKVEKDSPVSTC